MSKVWVVSFRREKRRVALFYSIVLVSRRRPPPSIPEAGALPSVRSSRPYTTYELDAIRQQARRYSLDNCRC